MAAPASTDEFLDLVRKSGVTDDRRFTDYVAKNRAANALAPDASRMAGLLVRDGILTQFQAEQILLGKWRRFTIGKYKVLERLGAGGMGSVYLCEHKLMRRRVAVKVLPTAKATDQSALERFYREARAVAALDHPNIVHAYDIDQDEQLHFLVMEYVDGVNLQDMVKKSGPIDILRACHYIRQSAYGLEHAHLAGLVHRDIKPGNILVDRGGTVKILDMGLARFFNDEDDILTKKFDENVLGTADYLAPEQAIDSHSVDIRADIYSLGATFYFLLTGRTPFGEGTVAQKLLWHQTRQPKVVSEFRKDTPPELVAIISKMMDKEADNRFQTPLELADALAPFTVTPIGPPPDSEMPTLSPAAQGGPPPDTSSDTAVSMKQDSPVPKALQSMGYATVAKPASGAASKPNHAIDTNAAVASVSDTPPVSPTPKTRSDASDREVQFTLADNPSPSPRPNLPTPRKKPISGVKQSAPQNGGDWGAISAKPAAPEATFEATDFVPVSRPASSKKNLKPSAAVANRAGSGLKKWLILGGIGVVSIAVIVGLAVVFATRPLPKGPEGGGGRKPFEVKGPGSAYPRILDVLNSKKLRKGDVILLDEENHRENLFAGSLPTAVPEDVVIKPTPGKEVNWSAKSLNIDFPLIHWKNTAGLKIQGPGLTIDGSGGKIVVEVEGRCPGLTFENVKFKGYQAIAVKIINAEGSKELPITFKDCEFLVEEKLKPNEKRIAFLFDIDPTKHIKINDYIEVDNPQYATSIKTPVMWVDRNSKNRDKESTDAKIKSQVIGSDVKIAAPPK